MTREEWLTKFGAAVRAGRVDLGWSVAGLSQKSGIPRSSLLGLEAGRLDVPASAAAELVGLLGIEFPVWRVVPGSVGERVSGLVGEVQRIRGVVREIQAEVGGS